MKQTLSILAAGEDATIKIVVGIAVAVFWLITQAAAAMSKKPDKRRAEPFPEMPPRPIDIGSARHPDLPGPRRGVATKMGLPKPAANKRQQTIRVQPRPAPTPGRAAPPPLPRPAQQPVPRAVVKKSPQSPQSPPRRRPAQFADVAVPTLQSAAGRSTTGTIQEAATTPARAGQSAAPLARGQFIDALLKPRNLRKAYVLTEILQKPIALRD